MPENRQKRNVCINDRITVKKGKFLHYQVYFQHDLRQPMHKLPQIYQEELILDLGYYTYSLTVQNSPEYPLLIHRLETYF